MRRIWPLVLLLALSMTTAMALPSASELDTNTSFYRGRGLLKDGGNLLFFRQPISGEISELLTVKSGGKNLVIVVDSGGTIYYLDSLRTVKVVNACAGRIVKVAHASTNKGGVLLAVCWKQQDQVMSSALIFDNGGVRWFAIKRVSRANQEGSDAKFTWLDYKSDFPESEEPPSPIAADFDGDGYDEIVWYMDGHLLYLDNPLGQPNETIVDRTPRGFAYGDVNGDGRKELIMTTSTDILTWRPGGAVHTYSAYGCSSKPLLADFNGDGVNDVACLSGSMLIVVNGNKLLMRANGVATLPSAGDLDGDGRADLVYIKEDGSLVARSLERILWSAKVNHPFYTPALGDVDGDTLPEVVVTSGRYLRVFSWEGKEEWKAHLRDPTGWVSGGKIELQTYVRYEGTTSPLLVDFDNDGLIEVMLGVGAYLEAGRVALIDEVSSGDKPPSIDILSPGNYTTVGRNFTLSFRVSDDSTPVIGTSVYRLVGGDWIREWSGNISSGDITKLNIPSADEIRIEASDGLRKSSVILKLRVDVKAPHMEIEPRNMSKIGPGVNITVRIIAPINEYAFLTVYHGTGLGGQWVRILNRRRVWKTSKVIIDPTPIVKMVSGYHCFKFVLEDPRGNREEVIMRYRIGKGSNEAVARQGDMQLSLLVPQKPVSKSVNLSWILIGVENATLYYGNEEDWNLLREVSKNGSFIWDITALNDGIYKLKLQSGNLTSYSQIQVDNTPPRISISADKSELDVGEIATVTVQTDAIKLYWDLNGDGTFETLGPKVARIEAREPGAMKINVKGVDEANNSAVASIVLKVREPKIESKGASEQVGGNVTVMRKEQGLIEELENFVGGFHLGSYEAAALLLAISSLAIIKIWKGVRESKEIERRREGRGRKRKKKRRGGKEVVNPWKSL